MLREQWGTIDKGRQATVSGSTQPLSQQQQEYEKDNEEVREQR